MEIDQPCTNSDVTPMQGVLSVSNLFVPINMLGLLSNKLPAMKTLLLSVIKILMFNVYN